ncbi:MAG TPA: SusC/RagA family TonB-linked outer membrane protein [Chitinophagaceae bacterium]|nr:SusC/RagA family TonB-linked outer membrane protein [Chitinophagaceae bacterium]
MRNYLRLLVGCLLLMLFIPPALQAQERTITGVVTGTDGALEGVTVVVKETNRATQTNASGNFTIQASTGQTLHFSFVGYEEQDLKVGTGNALTVKLNSQSNTMQDVVVVGYSTQRRGNLTGAVSTVDVPKTLQGRPIADVGRGLQGAASGLSVTIPSGEVGSDPIIKIRGQIGSLNGGSAPLILLDNVEIPSIQVVNPNDIASITILKDAASASIYGAKASFGVVLITTKKGATGGKPQISYSGNISFQNVWKDLKMADVNALKYILDASERIGNTSPRGAFYFVDRASYKRAVEWKEKYGNTIGPDDPTVFGRDWYVQGANQKMGVRTYNPYDYMVKEWTPTQQHNLSVGFTQGKTSYNIGLGLLQQNGMNKPAKKDEFSRYNISMRISSELNKYVTVRAGGLYSRRNKQYPYATNSTTADPWYYLYRWSSLYPLGYDENGDIIRSPYSEMASANTANILQNYSNYNLGATVNITKNWKVDFDYTYSLQDDFWNRPGTRFTARDSWVAPTARFDAGGNRVYVDSTGSIVNSTAPGAIAAYDLTKQTYTGIGSNPDHIARTVTNFFSHTINAFTTYSLNLKEDHAFKFILGMNRVAATTESQTSQYTALADIYNPQFSFGTGTQTVSGGKSWEAQLGYFGRVNYAFRNKYLLEGNLRYDGSSKFPKDLWWRWFPSVSAGWVASEENFFQSIKSTINLLKLRASWGSVGDQSVPPSLYVPVMPNTPPSTWIANGVRVNYVGTPTVVSPDITWQNIVSKNIGVDLGILNNKLNVSFDLFQRNTNDMIVGQEGIPLTLGAPAPNGNFASLVTRGWELTLDFNHTFNNGLHLSVRGNISDAKSKLYDVGSSTQITSNYDGKTVGEIWGYRTDRLYQMSDFELDGNGKPILITLTQAESALNGGKKAYKLKSGDGKKPIYQPFLQNSSNFYFGPGDVKFIDVNGDGEISNGDGTLANHGDLEVIGNSNPRYEYGFRVGADYKGFDLSVFFQGVGSRKIWGNGMLASPGYNVGDGAMPEAIAGNYWTTDNTGAFYPAAFDNGVNNAINNMQVQDRYLLNMAYIRLKNLTVGYSLSPSVIRKLKVLSSFRVYVALENFITWDHLRDLPIDPEAIDGYSMWNSSNYNSGRTGMGIPAFKSVSFGVQVNF